MDERASRYRVVGSAARFDHHLVDNRHRIAPHLELDRIELHGAQRPCRRVEKVPTTSCA